MLSPRRALTAVIAAALATSFVATAQAQPPSPTPTVASDPVAFGFVGRYSTELGGTSAEIATVSGNRLYVANADDVSVDVVNIAKPSSPKLLRRIDLSAYGAEVTSVAAGDGLVAATVVADPKTEPGTVVFLNSQGRVRGTAEVGPLPDSVTFTPDGEHALVANEGEPNSYGQPDSVDPEGSISIVTIPTNRQAPFPVTTVGFEDFNVGGSRAGDLPEGVRIFGPGATVAQDLEPEYVTVSPDGETAYVTLQENNALAVVDVSDGEVDSIVALGEKDHATSPLDASDRDDAINIKLWPGVFGMYQPDQAATFTADGETYIVTANEGDAREYDGFEEEERAADVADTTLIPAANDDAQLGRLTVTTAQPATASAPTPADQSELYAFGARSFSIWDSEGSQVWDSGDMLEQLTAAVYPGDFNSTDDENDSFDNRSDNKGPEPEAAATGVLDGRTLAFIGLERQGGVVITDVTDPTAPEFVQYLVTRNFSGDDLVDAAPESITFVADGPGGQPLLAVSHEVTGTVALFSTVPADGPTGLTLLHNNDGESALLPFQAGGLTVAGVAAFKTQTDDQIRTARDAGNSVLDVYAGDAFLAGATLTCSLLDPTAPVLDAVAQRRIAYDAHVFGNHEFDLTPDFLERFIREFEQPDGRLTQPFLSANLDFSGELGFADLIDDDGLIVGQATDGRVVARSLIKVDPTTTSRIGVVAATTPDLPNISSPREVVVTSDDIESTAAVVQGEIDRLTDAGVNKIVLVSHLQNADNDAEMIGLLRDVDLAVAGGGDELLANDGDLLIPGDGEGRNPIVGPYPRPVPDADSIDVPLVTTNGNYKYVGRLDVSFDAGGVATVDGGSPKRVVVDTGSGAPADAVMPDPGLVTEVQTPVEECLDELAATPVAETEVLFDRSRPGVRSGQANTGNLVSDAWLASYDRYAANVGLPARDATVVAIQNGGGIRQNGGVLLPSDGSPGVISRLDVINTLPFDNTMAVVENVTPAELKQIFERAGSSLPGEGGQFLQVAGLAVTYDPNEQAQEIATDGTVTTPGSRVVSIQLTGGTSIVSDGSVEPGAPVVTIVTNNFTAGGGDNYPWLRDNPFKTTLRNLDGLAIPYEQALREYLESFTVGGSLGLPFVPATDTRYSPFPTGETRITVGP